LNRQPATRSAFGLNRKYEKFPDLIISYVWHLNDRDRAVTFAMTYDEALGVADEMGWTRTASWAKGAYSTSSPSSRLNQLLCPYQMGPGAWRARLLKSEKV